MKIYATKEDAIEAEILMPLAEWKEDLTEEMIERLAEETLEWYTHYEVVDFKQVQRVDLSGFREKPQYRDVDAWWDLVREVLEN